MKKPFNDAVNVLDFLEKEIVWYGGFSFRERFGDDIEFSAGVTRTNDNKLEFYSTLSNYTVEIWLMENMLAEFSYEYDWNVDGTLGSGDIQVATAKVKIFF